MELASVRTGTNAVVLAALRISRRLAAVPSSTQKRICDTPLGAACGIMNVPSTVQAPLSLMPSRASGADSRSAPRVDAAGVPEAGRMGVLAKEACSI